MDDLEQNEQPRRRLGRGLNALLGSAALQETTAAEGDHSEVHVDLIERNPYQPRLDFEPEALNELCDSIKTHGVLQPLLVRPLGDRYQLIAGERRLLASKKAGRETVPCRVLEISDQQVFEVALEENLKRRDLNVLEKAQAFQEYLNKFQCTIEELGRRLSLDRSTVSNMLRLLELPDEVKVDLSSGRLTQGHARSLLSLPVETQLQLRNRILEEGLSVRKTEEAVRQIQRDQQPSAATDGETVPFPEGGAARENPMTAHVAQLQDQLRDLLGCPVAIKLKGKEKGRIVIDFGSNDDFERIVGHLRRAA